MSDPDILREQELEESKAAMQRRVLADLCVSQAHVATLRCAVYLDAEEGRILDPEESQREAEIILRFIEAYLSLTCG